MNDSKKFDLIYTLIQTKYNPHLYGDCNVINSTVAVVLKKLGYNPKLYTGYVITCQPFFDNFDFEERYDINHCFIKIDNIVYDFAASQMQEFLDEDFYDSYMIDEHNSYIAKREHSIEYWADFDLVNQILRQLSNIMIF